MMIEARAREELLLISDSLPATRPRKKTLEGSLALESHALG